METTFSPKSDFFWHSMLGIGSGSGIGIGVNDVDVGIGAGVVDVTVDFLNFPFILEKTPF